MTDLPLTILAELRAASNGECIANFSGPNASEFQFWRACAGGRIVLAQLFPDGSYEVKP